MQVCLAVLSLVWAVSCSSSASPSPETVIGADGQSLWLIQPARCDDGGSCSPGVFINRFYYPLNCGPPWVADEQLGEVFAVSGGTPGVPPQARTIVGTDPGTLALRSSSCDGAGDGWVASSGGYRDTWFGETDPSRTQATPVSQP